MRKTKNRDDPTRSSRNWAGRLSHDSYLEDELIVMSRTRLSSMDRGDSSRMVDNRAPPLQNQNSETSWNSFRAILVAME
jgi:hypothetical protein